MDVENCSLKLPNLRTKVTDEVYQAFIEFIIQDMEIIYNDLKQIRSSWIAQQNRFQLMTSICVGTQELKISPYSCLNVWVSSGKALICTVQFIQAHSWFVYIIQFLNNFMLSASAFRTAPQVFQLQMLHLLQKHYSHPLLAVIWQHSFVL